MDIATLQNQSLTYIFSTLCCFWWENLRKQIENSVSERAHWTTRLSPLWRIKTFLIGCFIHKFNRNLCDWLYCSMLQTSHKNKSEAKSCKCNAALFIHFIFPIVVSIIHLNCAGAFFARFSWFRVIFVQFSFHFFPFISDPDIQYIQKLYDITFITLI